MRGKSRVAAALVLVALVATALAITNGRSGHSAPTAAKAPVKAEPELAPRLAAKLAHSARFAPSSERYDSEAAGEGYAAEDWLMHSVDGQSNGTPPFSAFATARNDWFGLLGRPARGTGAWVPLGPTNGQNDLTNVFRDRTVYTAGTQNFGGRTNAGVISPDCSADACTMWIAASNGGVWRTDNALAAAPDWSFQSQTFEQQNTSSLELDPNDASHQTIWAGTGEPNACGSGCEVGVGVYVSKSGGQGWQGPLGADVFFGRGVGDIQVKPGDSNTIFVADGRATRGISNSCCGGTDALIPGAPHFGVYRSQDGGKSWQLVNQGANALCTAATPDAVSLNQTACSPRGARYVRFDPTDPDTVYASFFARGIWRSQHNGDPGTWEQIMAPKGFVGAGGPTTELDAFDVVALPSGDTRMYVGAGGGNYSGTAQSVNSAHLRVNDAVRTAPAATVQAGWVDKFAYSFAYCEPQCSYDNYVYAPANPENAPASGADANTVYLSGSNGYNENNTGTGRSNGRAVLLSTNAGDTFTDMTEDDQSDVYPGALHPDHHALLVNPKNYKQFFDLSDGGINRSNGVLVNDSGDCTTPPHSFVVPSRVLFCQTVLSRVPQKLDAINKGLHTLAFYTLDYNRANPDRLAGGTQDNGSWETMGSTADWLQINIADGGANRFDATGADPSWAMTAWQSGQLEVRYNPQQQSDVNWIADNLTDSHSPYAAEASAFMVPAISDPKIPGHLFTGREHVFRSDNYGVNPVFATRDAFRANCNVWYGVFGDLNGDNNYTLPEDACDDWKALGDPSPAGRLTGPAYGADKTFGGSYVSVTQRAESDTNTLWAATSGGRIFVSTNANAANPTTVQFTRIDNLDPKMPARFVSDIYVDRTNPNHAWITFSGYNAKTPATPGHVFEATFTPASGTKAASVVFTNLDGQKNNGYGDIPANSIIASDRGTLYVGNDYGVVVKEPNSPVWKMSPAGLPNVDVADLTYIPQRDVLLAATHGEGVWQLKTQ